ncbi:MAG: PKD domain-containing protein, partial [Bacteriovorax sp.]|nr:PKD domain-containing protein [Bacteriovorax sp.]
DGSPVTHQFSQSGDHSVVLTVIDNDGGVSTVTKTYSVLTNIAPVANFSCTNTTVRTIRCTSTSSDSDGVIASTTWALDDRSTYNGLNFERIFTDDQAHVIKLQVTDDLGASTSTSSTVQPIKNQAPQADLYASMTSGIAPLAINFEARSALDVDGSIASIEWTFSDGTTALGANVSHTFTNVGSFSATLKVTDNLGAVTIKSASITALEPLRESPGVAFKYFEDGSTQITLISNLTKTQFELDHAIYTIDGSQTIPVTEFYPGTRTLVDLKNYGVHTITLTVFDVRGQSASATYQVNLLQDPSTLKPIVDFKITQSNVRTAFFNFNRSFNPDIIFGVRNFRIDYGDGTFANTTSSFATHTYASAGSYTATLTVTTTQGTISSASKIVTVSDQSIPILNPVASFGYQINSWARNVSFYNDRSGTPNGSIISYLWDFGDGSTGTGDRVAHFYEPGDYFATLTVTDSAGLRNSQTQHVSIYQAGSDLVANIDCGTATTQTQNCNINALDRLNQISSVRVLWGDGTSSTLTNPTVPGQGLYKASKKYFTSGMQTIGLYVYTTRGEVGTATVTKNIILPNPVASINCYSNNLLANCNALASYDPKGGPLTFTFNYQDGFVETNASGISSHAYQAAGLYNVTVTVKDITGLSSVAATVVQMVVPQNKLPHPLLYCFSNSPNILRCNANASYDEDGTIVSYRYDWDDNASEVHAGSDEIFHIFTTSGSHQVTLTVTDNDGGVNSITNSFNVQANNPPVAVIHCYNIGPQKIHCNSDSYESDPNDLISEFKWDLGDGSSPVTTMVPSIEYFYAEFGSYNISLQVKDLLGANSSSSQNITVLENKAPILNPNCFINTGSTYQCNSNAYDPDGTIVSQTWTVEGETLSGPTINHTFANGGSYQVSLLVIDNLGKQTSQTITLNIDKPNINFECHETDPMMYQCLMDYSSVSNEDDPVVSSTFIFDDQQMLPGPGVIYEFYSFGVHSVKVKLRTASGKISTLNQNISIPQKYLPPRPLYLEEVLMDKKVYFDGSLSALAGKAVAQYEWDFGDGQIISGTNAVITHQFNSYGWFDVKLKVTDDRGAVKDTVSAIYVYDPQVEAPADSTSSSIAGVDTDSDGIRDDVQRWINKNSFESLTAKRAFKALAGIYKTQILNVNNESTLQSLENQKAKAAACVDSLIVAEYGVTKSVEFELIYLNSNARMLNFAKIKDSLSGYIPKMTPAQQTDVCADWR